MTPTADLAEAGRGVLRKHWLKLLKTEDGVRRGDMEAVHDMRVATRRLRSALRDFMPLMDKRPSKRVRKELKRLADALGAVRDQDVALVALEALQNEAEDEAIKEGIGKLLEERNGLRETARLNLTETLAAGNLSDL